MIYHKSLETKRNQQTPQGTTTTTRKKSLWKTVTANLDVTGGNVLEVFLNVELKSIRSNSSLSSMSLSTFQVGYKQSTPLLHNLSGSKSNHRLQLIASYNFPNYLALPELDIYKRKELISKPGLTISLQYCPSQCEIWISQYFVKNPPTHRQRNSEACGLPTTCLLRFSLVGSNFQIGANLHQFSGLVPTLSPLGTPSPPTPPFGPN